jgi:microcin C transport system substrate-binding protein
VTDLLLATEMLKRGELHYVRYFEPTDLKKYLGSGDTGEAIGIKTKEYRAGGQRTLALNNRLSFFSDVKVRQALSLLFPRDEINQKLFHGLLTPAVGTTNLKNLYADPTLKPMPYDPTKALQLLREAGWVDEDKNGILERVVDGKKTEFRFTILNFVPEREKLLTLFQESAKKLGIEVGIRTIEAQTAFKLFLSAQFDAIYAPMMFTYASFFPSQELLSTNTEGNSPTNLSGYKNTRVDELVHQADAEFRNKERRKIQKEIYRQVAKDMPEIPWFDDFYLMYGVSKKVKRPKDAQAFSVGIQTWSWAD